MFVVQPDYGGFNSKFFGRQLRFHGSQPNALLEFLALYTRGPRYVVDQGNAALRGTDEAAFHTFSLATTVFHETRHFHDSLLSRLGNNIFRLRVNALFHGIQGVPALKASGFVPVPLTRWVGQSKAQQETQLDLWSRFTGGKRGSISLLPDEIQMIEIAGSKYERIRQQLGADTTAEVQPVHLFEASAVMVQIVNVYRLFGREHAERFLELLLHTQVPAMYTKVLKKLFGLWDDWGADQYDFRAMSAVVNWSILGGYEEVGDQDYPTERFGRLCQLLANDGLPDAGLSVSDWFSDWDLKLHSTPVLEVLEANVVSNENLAKLLMQNLPPGDKLTTLVAQQCARMMDIFAGATRQMLVDFESRLESYIDPGRYIEDTAFIDSPIRLDFHSGGVDPAILRNTKLEIWKTCPEPGGRTMVTSAFTRSRSTKPTIDTDMALDTVIYLMLGDLLFSQLSRDDPDFDAARQFLRKNTGIIPLEIF